MKNPIDAVKGWGAGLIVGQVLKAIAEGKAGRFLQWLYLHLNGLITIIGCVLMGVGFGIGWLDSHGMCDLAAAHWGWIKCAVWAAAVAKGIAYLGVFVTWIGTVNGGVKLDPPDPKNLRVAFESLRK